MDTDPVGPGRGFGPRGRRTGRDSHATVRGAHPGPVDQRGAHVLSAPGAG